MKIKFLFKNGLLCLALLSVVPVATVNAQTTFGAGVSVGSSAGDTTAKIEIYLVGESLSPGTYDIADFDFDSVGVGTGSVTPLLATLNGGGSPGVASDTFTSLWVGPAVNTTASEGVIDTSYSAGMETFTLATTATIYVGTYAIATTGGGNGANVGYAGSQVAPSATDLDGDNALYNEPTAADQTITGSQSSGTAWQHADLNRAYDVSLTVEPAPEPSTAVLTLASVRAFQ